MVGPLWIKAVSDVDMEKPQVEDEGVIPNSIFSKAPGTYNQMVEPFEGKGRLNNKGKITFVKK